MGVQETLVPFGPVCRVAGGRTSKNGVSKNEVKNGVRFTSRPLGSDVPTDAQAVAPAEMRRIRWSAAPRVECLRIFAQEVNTTKIGSLWPTGPTSRDWIPNAARPRFRTPCQSAYLL